MNTLRLESGRTTIEVWKTLPSEPNDSAADRDRHGAGAIAGAQLLHDVLDVHLDRLLGDEQPLGDVAIPVAAGDVLQDVDLAARQRLVREMFGELRGGIGRDPFPA